MNILNEIDLIYERIRGLEKDIEAKETQEIREQIKIALGASITALTVTLAMFMGNSPKHKG